MTSRVNDELFYIDEGRQRENEMLTKLVNVGKTLHKQIYKERKIKLNDWLINRGLEGNLDKISALAGSDIRWIKIESAPEHLVLKGQAIHRNLRTDFSLKLRPLGVRWEEDRHQVLFEILDKSLEIDRAGVYGVLASLALAMVAAFTGEDVFSSKLKAISDEDGIVSINLDGFNDRLDHLLTTLELKQILSGDGHIKVVVQMREDDLKRVATGHGCDIF